MWEQGLPAMGPMPSFRNRVASFASKLCSHRPADKSPSPQMILCVWITYSIPRTAPATGHSLQATFLQQLRQVPRCRRLGNLRHGLILSRAVLFGSYGEPNKAANRLTLSRGRDFPPPESNTRRTNSRLQLIGLTFAHWRFSSDSCNHAGAPNPVAAGFTARRLCGITSMPFQSVLKSPLKNPRQTSHPREEAIRAYPSPELRLHVPGGRRSVRWV
jgi:hypothetical protein